MYPVLLLITVVCSWASAAIPGADGVRSLVARRLPQHINSFTFAIENATDTAYSIAKAPQDAFVVSNGQNNTVHIAGNSGIALSTGLRWYLTTYCHVDIYWFLQPTLDRASSVLPQVNGTYKGSSVVPWRYHFNTATFSYTSAFWTWDDWQLQLDWMALRGVNLLLAWNGYEKILVDVFLDAGFTQTEISTFLSGPAFQAWNRFANIQGSWVGVLPSSWLEGQFELNKQIVARMVELGMTPVLPCFTGFVPRSISRVAPEASFVNGSAWEGFPTEYTNVTFLEPSDPLFTELQTSFISKQQAAYGNITHIYTLDQYNENDPFSGALEYLRNVSTNTYASLKAADADAVWMLQGWLFFSSQDFWTDTRVEAYLSGVSNDNMIVLDLASEIQPQWQRTNNYYGKPWIWCELHDYGGNMGLYGQILNATINPVAALANESSSMIGMGLTMEGEEGNEIMYDLLLDQAWSSAPIDTDLYFFGWVSSRYGPLEVPQNIYQAWDVMRQTVYNNTNLTLAQGVTKSIFELSPNVTGLLNRTGHHPTTITYDPTTLVRAWQMMYDAASSTPSLWDNEAYILDLTDITRQVLANAFYPLYTAFIASSNSSLPSHNTSIAQFTGQQMSTLLTDLDDVLAASNNSHFSLSSWVAAAQSWSAINKTDSTYSLGANQTAVQVSSYYEYNALNQVTLWGPTGQINDYASKQWAGLVGGYYGRRWQLFVDFTLNSTTTSNGANAGLSSALLAFGEQFDLSQQVASQQSLDLKTTLANVIQRWPNIFC